MYCLGVMMSRDVSMWRVSCGRQLISCVSIKVMPSLEVNKLTCALHAEVAC